MKQLIDFFRSKTGTLLIFHLGLLLFNWPLMSITADKGGVGFFLYLFLAWAAVIAALALMAHAAHNDAPGKEED